MISKKTEEHGWEFIFVAANIDAIETARKMGIRSERATNYKQTKQGYADCYASMSEFVTMKRSAPVARDDSAWKKRLDGTADK